MEEILEDEGVAWDTEEGWGRVLSKHTVQARNQLQPDPTESSAAQIALVELAPP